MITDLNTSLATPGAMLTACNAAPLKKAKMAARWPQNGGRILERCLTPGYWALQTTFAQLFFWSEYSLYEKGLQQEKRGGGDIMLKIVGTIIVA